MIKDLTILSLTEILVLYLLASIFYMTYLWDKRHGPYEWEKKMGAHGTGHYKSRKYGMLVLAICFFIIATGFVVLWILDVMV